MKRKEFIKQSVKNLSGMVVLPLAIATCSDKDSLKNGNKDPLGSSDCEKSPAETAGPFPIKSPSERMKSNIISDRKGVALLLNLTIQDHSNECLPMDGVYVDVWQCDKDGYYSEYGETRLQKENFKKAHFLRGRQKTDINGQVSFISIFPGWYPGRAPHIHVEVLDTSEKSIRVTQIAFPEDVINTVYRSEGYNGSADTSNTRDFVFSNSLEANMADSIEGNINDGYTLLKTIVV